MAIKCIVMQMEDAFADDSSMQLQPAGEQQIQTRTAGVIGSYQSPIGVNTYTVAIVTGAVLYAQGLWGLW